MVSDLIKWYNKNSIGDGILQLEKNNIELRRKRLLQRLVPAV